MKNPHTNETIYMSYIFTDINGVKFRAYFRHPMAVKWIRDGYKTFCKLCNRTVTMRYFFRYRGITNKVKILIKGEQK